MNTDVFFGMVDIDDAGVVGQVMAGAYDKSDDLYTWDDNTLTVLAGKLVGDDWIDMLPHIDTDDVIASVFPSGGVAADQWMNADLTARITVIDHVLRTLIKNISNGLLFTNRDVVHRDVVPGWRRVAVCDHADAHVKNTMAALMALPLSLQRTLGVRSASVPDSAAVDALALALAGTMDMMVLHSLASSLMDQLDPRRR